MAADFNDDGDRYEYRGGPDYEQPHEREEHERTSGYRPRYTREIAWGVFIPIAALLFSMGTWSHGVYVDLLRSISALDLLVATNTAHRLEHDHQAQQWIDQIKENRITVRKLESIVASLRTVPSERPDPFTGTEGSALERRIRALEDSGVGDQ